jgi:peroxiredoxin
MSTALAISFALLWALVIFQTLVLLGLTRAVSRIQGRAVEEDGESVDPGLQGEPLPAFSEVGLFGEKIDNEFIAGRVTALLFVSPDCTTCSVTLDELEALMAKTTGNVVVFCRSTERRCRELAATYRLEVPLIVDEDLQLSRRFGVAGTPTAVLVAPDGTVRSYGQPMNGNELQSAFESVGDPEPISTEPLVRVVDARGGGAMGAT